MVLCCWKLNSRLQHFSGSSISEELKREVIRGKEMGQYVDLMLNCGAKTN